MPSSGKYIEKCALVSDITFGNINRCNHIGAKFGDIKLG